MNHPDAVEISLSGEDSQTVPTLCLFGRTRLLWGERCIDGFATKRSAFLLARIAISRQRRMLRTELADVLWPGDYFDATRLRLRQELTRLRKTLDEHSEIVSTQGDWIALDTSRVHVDVDDFEEAFRRSRDESDPVRRQEHLQRVVHLGEQPFLEGAQEDWIDAERARLVDLRYTAMVDLGGALLHAGKPEEALAIARQAIELIPSRESAHLLAMQVLGDMGHLADALTQYQVLRRNVVETSGGRLSARAEQLAASLREPATSEIPELSYDVFWSGIPVPPEPIFGREHEANLIAKRLDPRTGSARMITLLGVGGIGKTHLLLHASRLLSPHYSKRVAFVDLTEISDPKLVPLAIQKVLGSNHRLVEDPTTTLLNAIPNEPFLLALDNLEQLGSSLTPMLRRLMAERPALRILNSSRTALNLSGEFRLVLSPLALPPESAGREAGLNSPANQLFVSAVEAGRMGAKIDDADWPFISNIVRLLEGVPLALQLAASRFHILGAQGLLKALSENAELTNSREDAPARHRTIRAAVSGSFDHLEPELVSAMEHLSIFRGGWTLEAAEDVCGTSNAMRIMERLLDASLVYISAEGPRIRFRMLESIRQFVLSSLLDEDRTKLRRHHLDWVRSIAESVASEIVTVEGLARLDGLEPETDNIREAFQFALDTDPNVAFELAANLIFFWLYRTPCFEANRFYEDLFERYGDIEPSETVLRASYGQCAVSLLLDVPAWRTILERTLAMGIAIGDVTLRVRTYAQMIFQAQNAMHYERCAQLIREADAWVAEHGYHDDEGFLLRAKGNFVYFQGDLETSLVYFRQSLAWFERRGCVFSLVRVKLHIARASMEAGDYEQARRALDGLVKEVRSIRFSLLDAAVCETAGRLELRLGNYEEAMRYFNQAETGWRQGVYGFQVAAQFNHQGRVHLAMGNLPEATRTFVQAIDMWDSHGYPVAASVALYGIAAICLESGRIDDAARIFRAAAQECARHGAKLVPFEQTFADQCGAAIRALGGDIESPAPLPDALDFARRMVTT